MSRGRRSQAPAERRPARFFKIIHSFVVQEKRLGLPTKFVRKFVEELFDGVAVILKVPNGNIWKLGLRKDDGKVWFQSGWQEFAEYYSIRAGHFLVFRYDGDLNFFVLIFDKSCCEIDYPCDNRCRFEEIIDQHGDRNPMHNTNEDCSLKISACAVDDNDSVNLNDLISSFQSKNRKPLLTRTDEGSVPEKRIKIDSSEQCVEVVDDYEQKKLGFSDIATGKDSIQEEREIPVPAEVKAFKSDHPFFSVVMKPTYVSKKFALNVPFRSLKIHLKQRKQDVTLVMSSGKTWGARCHLYNGITKIYGGWEAFVRENSIKEGDTCVFELVETQDLTLKVSIFRVDKDATPALVRPSKSNSSSG